MKANKQTEASQPVPHNNITLRTCNTERASACRGTESGRVLLTR